MDYQSLSDVCGEINVDYKNRWKESAFALEYHHLPRKVNDTFS